MGLARGAMHVLLTEAARRPFSGRVATLGRQNIYFTYRMLERAAAERGVALAPVDGPRKSRRAVDDHDLFRMLGFDDYVSIDYSDFEGADVIFDLNQPELPDDLRGAFDVVIDGGTIEHVFHVPNVFKNIVELLRPGGRVIHLSPSSNHIDHGFYMFSPTLFWDFYRANGFDVERVQVFRYTAKRENVRWDITNYAPGSLRTVSAGGLDDGMYGVICIATKTDASTSDVVPQQGSYVETWSGDGPARSGRLGTLRAIVERSPAVHRAAARANQWRRSLRVFKGIRVDDRY